LDRSSAGLAILASLTPEEIGDYAAFVARRSPQSPAAAAIAERLADIRRAGFVFGTVPGGQVQSLAFPLRDEAGAPVGSITIEATGNRATPLDADPLMPDWRIMVSQAETLLRADARLRVNPYGHLDPDLIDFHER
jgi:DNA-binding IclR family transcriptional regulator